MKVTPPISPSPEISSQIHAISARPSFVCLLLVPRFFRADDLQADDAADEQCQEEKPQRVGRLAQEHHADDGRPGRPDAGVDGVRHAGLQHRHRFGEEVEADDKQYDGHRAWQRPREAFRHFHAVSPADLQQPADEYIKPCHDASDLSVIRAARRLLVIGTESSHWFLRETTLPLIANFVSKKTRGRQITVDKIGTKKTYSIDQYTNAAGTK